jgi:hypothetical protein
MVELERGIYIFIPDGISRLTIYTGGPAAQLDPRCIYSHLISVFIRSLTTSSNQHQSYIPFSYGIRSLLYRCQPPFSLLPFQ